MIIRRISKYTQNVGPSTLIINGLIFAYIMYIIFQRSSSGGGATLYAVIFIFPAAMIGLVGPLAVLPWMVKNAEGALSFARGLNMLVWLFIVLRLVGVVSMAWWMGPIIFQLIFLSFGITFWVLSDPRVSTSRGMASEIEAQSRDAGRAIAASIAQRWTLYNDRRSLGTRGPAGGEIIEDLDFEGRARLTLEQIRDERWVVIPRVEGVIDQQCSHDSQRAARKQLDAMMVPLGEIAIAADDIDDERAREWLASACERFITQFPPDSA